MEKDKQKFKDCIKSQISQLKLLNAVYSRYNKELFKVLIDLNLEQIEQLEILITE